ncbi:DUF397 domain-containing protein [Streptomyces sp. V4I2]|uniref:DUF397 domain-containing protein n=1 Tax=Streptomyces sp. V4I2 TaxID=3042280 RepID=UPI0035945068
MAALFGARVRRLRTAAGLTQAELGDKTHVVSTRITQIERASGAKPTLELARALNQAGGDCVEVADGFRTAVVPVRDSKVPHGPALCFEAASWAAFIGELKAGRHRS